MINFVEHKTKIMNTISGFVHHCNAILEMKYCGNGVSSCTRIAKLRQNLSNIEIDDVVHVIANIFTEVVSYCTGLSLRAVYRSGLPGLAWGINGLRGGSGLGRSLEQLKI